VDAYDDWYGTIAAGTTRNFLDHIFVCMQQYSYIELAILVPPFLKSGLKFKEHLKSHDSLEAFEECATCSELPSIDGTYYGVTGKEIETLYNMVKIDNMKMDRVFFIFGAYNMEHLLTRQAVLAYSGEATTMRQTGKSYVLGGAIDKTAYSKDPTNVELLIAHANPSPEVEIGKLPTFAKGAVGFSSTVFDPLAALKARNLKKLEEAEKLKGVKVMETSEVTTLDEDILKATPVDENI